MPEEARRANVLVVAAPATRRPDVPLAIHKVRLPSAQHRRTSSPSTTAKALMILPARFKSWHLCLKMKLSSGARPSQQEARQRFRTPAGTTCMHTLNVASV